MMSECLEQETEGTVAKTECVSQEEMNLQYCSGSCGMSTYVPDFNSIANGMQSNCKCCRPASTQMVPVSFDCWHQYEYDGKKSFPFTTTKTINMPLLVDSCSCSECDGKQLKSLQLQQCDDYV